MASRIWRFLTTDITELGLGETVGGTVEVTNAVFELAEVFGKEGPQVTQLAPLVAQLDSLLDVLNSPLAEIVEKGVPFIAIATGLLKFYLEKSQQRLTVEKCVAIASQAAYLESVKSLLETDVALQAIAHAPASAPMKATAKKLADLEISEEQARKTVTDFPNSPLAKQFGDVLRVRLETAAPSGTETPLTEQDIQRLVERVAWQTPRYLNRVWASSSEAVQHLGQPTFQDWQREQEQYASIGEYLNREIACGPQASVFNEASLTFADIYVPLEIKRLDRKGEPMDKEPPQDLEGWVTQHLFNPLNTTQDHPQILFIQGEAGRGKIDFSPV